jgi:hypothetical protein
MRPVLLRNAMSCLLIGLSCLCLPAAAQTLKIESQGQAAVDAEAKMLEAVAIARTLGQPPAGKGQVVFFRSAKSPGAAPNVQESGVALGDLPAGMYLVALAAPGTHAYDLGGANTTVSVNVAPGKTHYVQVIRTRKGQAQLLRSNAAAFNRAAK